MQAKMIGFMTKALTKILKMKFKWCLSLTFDLIKNGVLENTLDLVREIFFFFFNICEFPQLTFSSIP